MPASVLTPLRRTGLAWNEQQQPTRAEDTKSDSPGEADPTSQTSPFATAAASVTDESGPDAPIMVIVKTSCPVQKSKHGFVQTPAQPSSVPYRTCATAGITAGPPNVDG